MSKYQEMIYKDTQRLPEKEVKDYVFDRFEDVKNSKKIKNLVSFQAMNKYMIMAHDQNELKMLGNIVASYKKITLSEIFTEYKKHLKMSFKKSPTIKSHINVIMHIFGHFSKNFSQFEKEQFFKLLNDFKEEKRRIGGVLSEINPVIFRFNNTYLASQTYFLLYSDSEPKNLFHMLSQK